MDCPAAVWHILNKIYFYDFDFTNDLKNSFSKACGIKATNRTQGIGDAYLIVSGLK